jgi:hypothetical protein
VKFIDFPTEQAAQAHLRRMVKVLGITFPYSVSGTVITHDGQTWQIEVTITDHVLPIPDGARVMLPLTAAVQAQWATGEGGDRLTTGEKNQFRQDLARAAEWTPPGQVEPIRPNAAQNGPERTK